MERVFLKNKTKHFAEVPDWNGGLVILVCLAYRVYNLFLRYVCVEASEASEASDIETRITSAGTFVISTKFVKSVVSLRYESCDCATG